MTMGPRSLMELFPRFKMYLLDWGLGENIFRVSSLKFFVDKWGKIFLGNVFSFTRRLREKKFLGNIF